MNTLALPTSGGKIFLKPIFKMVANAIFKPEKVISLEPDWPKGHMKCHFLLLLAP